MHFHFLKDRIEVFAEPWVVLQIIPDISLKNRKLELLIRSLHELYKRKSDRITIFRDPLRIKIEEPNRFSFRIHMTKDAVNFFLAIPERWKEFAKQKIASIWDKATIIEASWEPFFNSEQTYACTLHLRRHNMLSISTDLREQSLLNSILQGTHNIKDNEQAMIDILAEPFSQMEWEYEATKSYTQFQKGNIPKRFDFTWKAAGRTVLELIATILRELFGILSDFVSTSKQGEKESYAVDPEAKLLALKGLSHSTKNKAQLPPFNTWIRVVAQSSDPEMAQFTCRSLATSFRSIAEDNELDRREVKQQGVANFLERIHRRTPHGFVKDVLSSGELAKLMQLPEEQTITEYQQITSIQRKEVSLPSGFFRGGIPFSYHTEKGNRRLIHIPTDNHSIFCIPHIAFGPSGCGKSTLAKNMAIGSINQGFSVFLIDTADGEVIDGARNALPTDFPDDHIIDLDFGNVKYPIPLNLSDVATFDQADGDDELGKRIVANKIKDSLIHFIKNISSYGESGFTDRMEEIFGAVGKAILRNPQDSLLEVALALVSPEYLEQLLADPSLKESNIQVYEILCRLLEDQKKGTSRAKIDPIISRINLLTNNEFSANLFLQRNRIGSDGNPLVNFRKWADGDTHPYFIGIRVPKDDFGVDMTNRITAFILQKWYLAILSRTNIKPEVRKPCLLIWDEPHTAIDASGHILENMAVELRKYKGKPIFLAHGPRQFKNHWGALTTGGFTLSVYKTKEVSTMVDLQHDIDPFTPQEALSQLPEKFWSITKLAMHGQSKVPAFLAEMLPAPNEVKDRSNRREECSKLYGTLYKEVEADIFERKKILFQNVDDIDDIRTTTRKKTNRS